MQLQPGVSLWGGFTNDWTLRDSGTYATIVEDSRSVDGTAQDPVVTLDADGLFGRDTEVDGLSISSGAGAYSAAVGLFDGASLVVSNCQLACRGGDSSSAIYVEAAAPLITQNIISAGTGGQAPSGVAIGSGYAVVRDNSIDGGDGDNSRAIVVRGEALPGRPRTTSSSARAPPRR